MGWFGKPQRRQTAPATPIADARQAWQVEDMAAALKIPEHTLLDGADVSAGSRGYSLHALERAGLMRIERIARESPTAVGGWRFTPTPRAKRYAADPAQPAGEAPAPARKIANEGNQGQAEEGQGPETERLPAEPQRLGRPAAEAVAPEGDPPQGAA